jgi:hypothetical protein
MLRRLLLLADRATRQRYWIGSLRFGDLATITNAGIRRGPIYAQDRVTIGVIVHGDSTHQRMRSRRHSPAHWSVIAAQTVHDPRLDPAAIFAVRQRLPLA